MAHIGSARNTRWRGDFLRDLKCWACPQKKCAPCLLAAVAGNDAQTEYVVRAVHAMREVTFQRREYDMFDYIMSQLRGLIPISSSRLGYVVAGMQTCRDAWNYVFSTVTSARAHAEFNKQYSLANPVLPTSDKIVL